MVILTCQQAVNMSRSTKPRNDWDAIRLDYLKGIQVREIGIKYNIDHAQIVRKAKAKRWGQHNEIGKRVDRMIDDVRKNTDVDKVLDVNEDYELLQKQLNVTVGSATDDILRRFIIKKMILQHTQLDQSLHLNEVINTYTHKLHNNIKKSPDGLYTKSIGQGGAVTYGSYADDLAKVAVPILAENNKSLGMSTNSATVAVQNNINTNNTDDDSSTVKIYIPDNKRKK